MVLKELFLVIIGIGLGYLLMNYVQVIADNAMMFGVILIIIGVLGKLFVKS